VEHNLNLRVITCAPTHKAKLVLRNKIEGLSNTSTPTYTVQSLQCSDNR